MAGATVDKRVGAAGVVAHHAAYAAAVGGGCLGAEEETVGFERFVEFVAHHSGLHPYPALLNVNLYDMVEMTAYVYDNAVADYLTCNAGAACAWYEVGVVATSLSDELNDVVLILWISNTKR